jgi:hypothetical protein
MIDQTRDTMFSSTSTLASVELPADEEKQIEQDDIARPQHPDEENPALPSRSTNGEKTEDVGEMDHFLVKWEKGDPKNPYNWTLKYKSWITFQLGMLALAASLGSSIIAPAEKAVAEEFGLSQEVAVLSISLYVLGFAFGPCL